MLVNGFMQKLQTAISLSNVDRFAKSKQPSCSARRPAFTGTKIIELRRTVTEPQRFYTLGVYLHLDFHGPFPAEWLKCDRKFH
jgi:hypothetical protein